MRYTAAVNKPIWTSSLFVANVSNNKWRNAKWQIIGNWRLPFAYTPHYPSFVPLVKLFWLRKTSTVWWTLYYAASSFSMTSRRGKYFAVKNQVSASLSAELKPLAIGFIWRKRAGWGGYQSGQWRPESSSVTLTRAGNCQLLAMYRDNSDSDKVEIFILSL